MSGRVVIVGAGHGAAQLCVSLVESGWKGSITLIGDEPVLPYHRPPLSKTQLDPAVDHELQLIRPATFYQSAGIEFISGTRVEHIDRTAKFVRAGDRTIAYDTLVLCTGSVHRNPPIKGIDHPCVFRLRTAADAAAIRGTIAAASSAVIIGAGFIGLEIAASLRSLGRAVTVLEAAPRVLSRVTSPTLSTFYEALHRQHGVTLHTGILAGEIRETSHGLVVITSTGETHHGDFVVVGTGAAACTDLAEAADIAVDNGIRVDAFNRTSDPDIYALGDCCTQWHPLYQQWLRLESVQHAGDQARTVAGALTGNPHPHTALPWFWSDQYDVKLQIAGVSTGYDAMVLRGRPESGPPFSAWYFKAGALLAVDGVNDSVAYAVGTKLLKSGRQPDPTHLADVTIDLKTILKDAKESHHACS